MEENQDLFIFNTNEDVFVECERVFVTITIRITIRNGERGFESAKDDVCPSDSCWVLRSSVAEDVFSPVHGLEEGARA